MTWRWPSSRCTSCAGMSAWTLMRVAAPSSRGSRLHWERILQGKSEIGPWLEDICARDMTHAGEHQVAADGRAAFTQSCRYPDGTQVLCCTVLEVRDGRISRQAAIQLAPALRPPSTPRRPISSCTGSLAIWELPCPRSSSSWVTGSACTAQWATASRSPRRRWPSAPGWPSAMCGNGSTTRQRPTGLATSRRTLPSCCRPSMPCSSPTTPARTTWLPALEGVTERLERGIRVADIGCGYGAATILLAQAYPNSTINGFDYHDGSVATARDRAAKAGAGDRLSFDVAGASEFPGSYDLVCLFDCLHDMGDPVGAA